MDQDAGFVKAGKDRLRVLEMLKSGSFSGERIAKRLRIPGMSFKKTINDLVERNLIKKEGEEYNLTENGLKVIAEIGRPG